MYEGEVIEYGYPRNDILYNINDKYHISTIKATLQLPLDKQIILYAPTWREGQKTIEIDIEYMRSQLSATHVLILRIHHLVRENVTFLNAWKSFVFDFSMPEYDIQELMLVSDLLLTDYSSVAFDYAILRRPMIFYLYDYENYKSAERGLYMKVEDVMPGKIVYEMEGLVECISKAREDMGEYEEKYSVFLSEYCSFGHGDSAMKVVGKVF